MGCRDRDIPKLSWGGVACRLRHKTVDVLSFAFASEEYPAGWLLEFDFFGLI